jgi:hypothetical protein
MGECEFYILAHLSLNSNGFKLNLVQKTLSLTSCVLLQKTVPLELYLIRLL